MASPKNISSLTKNEMTLKTDKIVYSLSIEDVQNVGMQEIGRELTASEIDMVVKEIEKEIDWYDAISNSINEVLGIQESHKK